MQTQSHPAPQAAPYQKGWLEALFAFNGALTAGLQKFECRPADKSTPYRFLRNLLFGNATNQPTATAEGCLPSPAFLLALLAVMPAPFRQEAAAHIQRRSLGVSTPKVRAREIAAFQAAILATLFAAWHPSQPNGCRALEEALRDLRQTAVADLSPKIKRPSRRVSATALQARPSKQGNPQKFRPSNPWHITITSKSIEHNR